MSVRDGLDWFKREFGSAVAKATEGSPFDLGFLASIAYKETGHICARARAKGLGVSGILALCVGDTKRRMKFPVDRADLEGVAHGREVFLIARDALERVSLLSTSYERASRDPDAFCRGFGIFQYDLQFCKFEPEYFYERRYEEFGHSLDRCLKELRSKSVRLGLEKRHHLTFDEKVMLAIAYNRGSYNATRGLRQGNLNKSSGKYYGELFAEVLREAEKPY